MNRRSFLASSAAFAAATTLSFPAFAGSKKGRFRGDSNHVTKGSVTVKDGKITLESSFWFDGAPDPRVALGKGGKFLAGTDFAKLKKNSGKQTYSIPSSLKSKDFDTVVIWCRKFSVPLGHAKIS
ncbi:MAG: DM13 domain-containing protein [Rhizobiaceae bacterium]|nr:DM13 domain-containing protein [Rhizobiaceae bacterium]